MKESSVTHAMKSGRSTAFTAVIFLVLGLRLALVTSLHPIAGWFLGIAALMILIPLADRFWEWRQKRGNKR